MSAELTEIIIKVLVGLAVSAITSFLIPAIMSWLGNGRLAKLKTFVDNAVDASEQIFGPKTGEQKKNYVIDFIKTNCASLLKKLKISDETLDLIIEASVSRVSASIKQAQEVQVAVATATTTAYVASQQRAISETATETENGLIVAKQEEKKYRSKGDIDTRLISMS